MAEGWANCEECDQRFGWSDVGHHNHRSQCGNCVRFSIDIGPMDWRLLQCQRSCLNELVNSEHLTEEERDTLHGILNLLDFIIDEAHRKGRNVPDLDEVVLDRLSEVK